MAVDNKFEITYGGQAVGGSSDTYQLHGPHVIDLAYEALRLVFDVVVVASTYAELQSLSGTLESAFRDRDKDLVIDIDGSLFTYTFGTTLLNSQSEIAKSGDPDTDRGFSRAYTITITAELPAEETTKNGLRDMEMNVDYESSRQKIVTFHGVYTAVELPTAKLASVQYQDATVGFDPIAATLLSGLDGSATFELADENFKEDRNNHTCEFTRQYVELLANQSQGLLDDLDIRDHSLKFVDTSQHPGDSQPNVFRLRRVGATFDCSIDIDVTTDLQTVFTNKVFPYLKALFQTEFTPSVFCVEDRRVGYDETSKRMSVALQFLYQSSQGSPIIEVSSQAAIREGQTIDYTPIHNKGVFMAHADPGFAIAERISSRTVIAIGVLVAKGRIGGPINSSGWNVVANTSQIARKFVGDPIDGSEQMQVSVLTETVIERFHQRPGGGGSNYTPGGTRKPVFDP